MSRCGADKLCHLFIFFFERLHSKSACDLDIEVKSQKYQSSPLACPNANKTYYARLVKIYPLVYEIKENLRL